MLPGLAPVPAGLLSPLLVGPLPEEIGEGPSLFMLLAWGSMAGLSVLAASGGPGSTESSPPNSSAGAGEDFVSAWERMPTRSAKGSLIADPFLALCSSNWHQTPLEIDEVQDIDEARPANINDPGAHAVLPADLPNASLGQKAIADGSLSSGVQTGCKWGVGHLLGGNRKAFDGLFSQQGASRWVQGQTLGFGLKVTPWPNKAGVYPSAVA